VLYTKIVTLSVKLATIVGRLLITLATIDEPCENFLSSEFGGKVPEFP